MSKNALSSVAALSTPVAAVAASGANPGRAYMVGMWSIITNWMTSSPAASIARTSSTPITVVAQYTPRRYGPCGRASLIFAR
jgi:hypothetical protein